MKQTASVGRIVHYYYSKDEKARTPHAAIITEVHDEEHVSLTVFRRDGGTNYQDNVVRCDPEDGYKGNKWEWPPRK